MSEHTEEQGLRVHHLVNLGGLIAVAGLDREPPDFLLGALISVADERAELTPEQRARVAALGLITPSFDPSRPRTPTEFEGWDALAQGLRRGGVEGFLEAYDLGAVPEAWRETVEKVLRQRLSAHEHPQAVADALEVVPRSRPFEDMRELADVGVPTVVVASRDEADPGHPLAVGERYAQAIPGAVLVVEDAGPPARSPIAWQGGQLSQVLADLLARA